MKKRPSVREWADKYGVDIHIAEQYQKMRRRWMNRVTAFARKYGGTPSRDIPLDVRDLRPIVGGNFEQYIESRSATIESRSAIASKYLKQRQDTYLSNIASALIESNDYSDDFDIQVFAKWIKKAGTAEKAKLIAAIDSNGGLKILYRSKQATDSEPELRYDAGGVINAIMEVIYK